MKYPGSLSLNLSALSVFVSLTLSVLLSGCASSSGPAQYKELTYDLSPAVTVASARLTPQEVDRRTAVSVQILGTNSTTRTFGTVLYTLDKRYNVGGLVPFAGKGGNPYLRTLTAPEPVVTYLERATSEALATKGIAITPSAPIALALDLQRFEYQMDERTTTRKGFMEAILLVKGGDQSTKYQRRIGIEVAREKGSVKSTVGSLVSGLGGEELQKSEEREVAASVFADMFAKLQDEILADEELVRALRD